MRGKDLVVFDFGETLAYYGGTQLCWKEHYDDALTFAAKKLGTAFSPETLTNAHNRLNKFDTRANPRAEEYPSSVIFQPIAESLNHGISTPDFVAAFFQYFSRNIIVYPETIATLHALKQSGNKTAILTDVPYGMDTELVAKDLEQSNIAEHIDVLFSSVDVGYRKPDKRGLLGVLKHFGISPERAVFVGNEIKDKQCAINADVASVIIDRQASSAREDKGDHIVINTLSELLEL